MKDADVIILGAGAAGLSAAYELSRNNVNVIILEARTRVGGRVHTQSEPGLPVELGAEYMHGTPKSLMRLALKTQTPFVDAYMGHYYPKNGKLIPLENFWEQIQAVINRVDRKRTREYSVAEFLKNEKISSEERDYVEGFVQGYHAADLTLMGERTLQEEDDGKDELLQGTGNFRFPFGYLRLIKNFLRYIPEEALYLGTVAEKILWNSGGVQVTTFSEQGERTFRARRLICTLPLGVLKAKFGEEGAVQWSPMPENLDKALSGIEMGHIQKVVLRFRSRFWEDLSDQPIGFMHPGNKYYFSRFWTTIPLRFSQLTSWEGVPKAQDLSRLDEENVVQRALQTLSITVGKSTNFLNKELRQSFRHDWSNDPYARGAYSYIRVGGIEKSKLLSWPEEDTIFFAGEATAGGDARGTVHGAIESGLRSAKQILSRVAH